MKSSNNTSALLVEYGMRMSLNKLGITQPMSELSALKAGAFVIIDAEISKLKAEALRKEAKRAKGRRR